MDTNQRDRDIVINLLREYASIPYALGDLTSQPVIDTVGDHYILMTVGWDKNKRVHYPVIHIDLIGDKVWLQCDNTDAVIAEELVRAGIPKSRIVLGFQPPKVRPLIEDYAAA